MGQRPLPAGMPRGYCTMQMRCHTSAHHFQPYQTQNPRNNGLLRAPKLACELWCAVKHTANDCNGIATRVRRGGTCMRPKGTQSMGEKVREYGANMTISSPFPEHHRSVFGHPGQFWSEVERTKRRNPNLTCGSGPGASPYDAHGPKSPFWTIRRCTTLRTMQK